MCRRDIDTGAMMVRQLALRTTSIVSGLLLAAVLVAPLGAHAQPYPTRPIKIVVPYAAGGAVDIVARSVGQPLSETLKQPVIVDNRPGASANIGMELVAERPPRTVTPC